MAETAPATTEANPPPAEAAAPETPVEVSAKVKALQELGFENVTNDDEAFDRLAQAYQQTKEQFSTELKTALDELRAQQPAQPTQTQQDAQRSEKVDKRLFAQFRSGDGWKDGTPDSVKQQYESWMAARNAFAETLLDDPDSALAPIFEKRFNEFFEQKFGQVTAQQQEAQLQQKVFADNPWLFEKDPITGQPKPGVLSTEGQLLNEYFIEAQEDGLSFSKAWKYAHAQYQLAKHAAQSKLTTSAQSAEEINAQKKRELLLRGGGTPNRGGSLPAPSENRVTQRNRNVSFGQLVSQVASRNGVAVQ